MLSLLLVVWIGAGLITLAKALRMARLRGIAKAALRRSAVDVCRIDERFGLVEAINSEANARQAACAADRTIAATPRRSAVPVVTAPRPAVPLQDEQDPGVHPCGPSL